MLRVLNPKLNNLATLRSDLIFKHLKRTIVSSEILLSPKIIPFGLSLRQD